MMLNKLENYFLNDQVLQTRYPVQDILHEVAIATRDK